MAIRNDLIINLQNKILPPLIQKIGTINVPDTRKDISLVHISVTNIQAKVISIDPNNIHTTFTESNRINIIAENIVASGSFDINVKLLFVKESVHLDIRFNKIKLSTSISFKTVESNKEKGKNVAGGNIESLDIEVDFDFDIKGNIIAKVADAFKIFMKNHLKDHLMKVLKPQLNEEIKYLIQQVSDLMPIYMPYNKYLIDCSLTSAPKIINNFIILSLKGDIIDVNTKATKFPFNNDFNLPDFDPSGKQIQIFISEASLATALDQTDYIIHSTDISFFSLNTMTIGAIIPGMTKKYGNDKKVNIRLKPYSSTTVDIQNKLNLISHLEITLNVEIDVNKEEEALVLNSDIVIDSKGNLNSQGHLNIEIDGLNIQNTKLIKTNIPDSLDLKALELNINMLLPFVKDLVNKNFNSFIIQLPQFSTFDISDSTAELKNHYMQLNINPSLK